MGILAKKTKDGRTQSLEGHTFSVLDEGFSILDYDFLRLISEKYKLDAEIIIDLIFFSLYFHDIGKATEEFKETLEKRNKSYHSLYSAGVVSSIDDFCLENILHNEDSMLNLLMLIVISHHSLYKNTLFGGVNSDNKYQHTFLKDAGQFFYNYRAAYKKYLQQECKYEFEFKQIGLEELETRIDEYMKDDIKEFKKKKILRILYSYISGLLNYADWKASANFSGSISKHSFDKIPKKDEIIEKIKITKNLKEFKLRNFQEKLAQHKGRVFVEIPTGEGKTEGAYVWAVNNIRNKNSKIMYTLPTQTTSNKLFMRARDVFSDCTGLLHGSAKIYLEKLYEEEHGICDEAFTSELLFNSVFCKPVTISTIDSILKYMLNIGRYNIAAINMYNSVIILDEIHSYDFKLMGFLKRFLEFTDEFQIPVCIMSASIPDKIKDLLNLAQYPVITDKDLFNKKANSIIKVDEFMEDNIDLIWEKYLSGKNVLIVRNRIDSSLDIFKKLKAKVKDNVILYNSQFKKKDRIKKENEIYERLKGENKFILVATQVVEISLDIDFDVMFTDVAPVDSLIQRFGRVNRTKSTEKIGDIYIYGKTQGKPYDDRMLAVSFNSIEEGLHPIRKYNEWLNRTYNTIFEDISIIREIEGKFKKGYEKFDNNLFQLNGIEQSNDNYDLRDIEIQKNDYLLRDDYEKEIMDYENTVSLCAYLSDLKNKNNRLIIERDYKKKLFYDVLDLDYDYDYGVIFPENTSLEYFL